MGVGVVEYITQMSDFDPAFVGRSEELAVLLQVLDRAAGGELQGAVVAGEPGIGKTTLLRAAVAARPDLRPLSASPTPLDVEHPFAAVDQAVAALGGGRRRADLDPSTVHRAVDAAVDLIEAAALDGPLVVVVDDLQWIDSASAMVVRAITRRLVGLPIALLLGLRSGHREAETVLGGIALPGVTRLQLGPLDQRTVQELARQRLGGDPDAACLAHLTKAGGNPLLVSELLAALADADGVEVREGRAVLHSTDLPATLRSVVLNRLSVLPGETITALRHAAVLGPSFRVSDLGAWTGEPAVALASALRPAQEAGIVAEAGEELRFRHALVRDAIYEDQPLAIRRALHREVARRLAASGALAAYVAPHFGLAAQRGDTEAVEWLQRGAAETAATPAIAATFLEQALGLLDVASGEGRAVRLELAERLLESGRTAECEALARAALVDAEDAELSAATSLVVRSLYAQGRWAEEIAAIDAALEDGRLRAHRAGLLADRALARLFHGELDGGETDAREALRTGEHDGNDVVTSTALGHLAAIEGQRGLWTAAVEHARRGVLEARSEAAQGRHPHIPLAITLIDIDDFDGAEAAAREGLRRAEATGAVWVMPLYQTAIAMSAYQRGRYEDAVAEAEAGLGLGAEIRSHPVAFAAQCLLAAVAVHRGAVDAAEAHMHEARLLVEGSGPQWASWVYVRNEALLLEATGAPDAALAALTRASREFEDAGVVHSQLFVADDLLRLAIRCRAEVVAEVAAVVELAAPRAGTTGAAAAGLHAAGLRRREPERLQEAADLYLSVGRRRQAAAVLESAAFLAECSSDALRRAEELYENIGALGDADRVAALVRPTGAGGKRGRGPSTRRPVAGWASLTPAELRVVELASEGLTNPQIAGRLFISRYTVATHLAHVFAKLGLSSRVELAAAVARRGDDL
jgi:DNA-binding CsgD family transcriptional regulator